MNNLWKPTGSLAILKQRAFLMSEIRDFFQSRKVLEVETPILSAFANTDVNIESFSSEQINSLTDRSYLRTSPEFPLKRLISAGYGDVFEIGKVFRRGEVSKTHNMEFTMLEWYRIDYCFTDLMSEIAELFNAVNLKFNKHELNVCFSTFDQCFMDHLGINIQACCAADLNRVCEDHGYSGSDLNYDECLDYLFASQIQPHLGRNSIEFVSHYPATQAALAELDPKDPSLALRFEFFIDGIEFGNGYQELTDAEVLRQRFEKDNHLRVARGQAALPIDELLLNAMSFGLPKCSGVAVGVDRWLMHLCNLKSIKDAMSFSSANS